MFFIKLSFQQPFYQLPDGVRFTVGLIIFVFLFLRMLIFCLGTGFTSISHYRPEIQQILRHGRKSIATVESVRLLLPEDT